MCDEGREKIGEMLKAGLTLGSAGTAGAVLAVLQRSGREGTSVAVSTLDRGPLLKKLSDMKLIQAIRSKKRVGEHSEGLLRPAPSQALGAGD
jgi:cobalamin biosynthesis protein CbiD